MAATNTFSDVTGGIEAAAQHAFSISPSDSTDIAFVTRGLYVGGAGNVKVDMFGGETAIILVGLAVGVIHPIRVTRVYSTSTTATSIIGVY